MLPLGTGMLPLGCGMLPLGCCMLPWISPDRAASSPGLRLGTSSRLVSTVEEAAAAGSCDTVATACAASPSRGLVAGGGGITNALASDGSTASSSRPSEMVWEMMSLQLLAFGAPLVSNEEPLGVSLEAVVASTIRGLGGVESDPSTCMASAFAQSWCASKNRAASRRRSSSVRDAWELQPGCVWPPTPNFWMIVAASVMKDGSPSQLVHG